MYKDSEQDMGRTGITEYITLRYIIRIDRTLGLTLFGMSYAYV